MSNQFGKESRLYLKAEDRDGKTIIGDLEFTAPFKIMRPFYLKKGFMTVMLLTASAGIMDGDRQNIRIDVGDGCKLEFVSQAYEKIHRMEEGYASRTTDISVGEDSTLLYTPLPTIPFAGSDFRSSLRVDLAGSTSKFAMTEVLVCGRVFHGEKFEFNRFKNLIRIYQGGKLEYRDNTLYEPDWMDLEGIGFYEGFTHLANLVICNFNLPENWLADVRELIDDSENMEGGVTFTQNGFAVVRILGNSGQKLTDLMERILSTVIDL